MSSLPSICIPKVGTINKMELTKIFEKILGDNSINKIDFMFKNHNLKAFVYFNNQKNIINSWIFERFDKNQDIKIVFNNQIIKCYKNKNN